MKEQHLRSRPSRQERQATWRRAVIQRNSFAPLLTVAQGAHLLSEDVARPLAADRLSGTQHLTETLTPRETEILRLLATGLSSEEISPLLNLSQKTVRNHHYAIKAKIGARSDAHLVWLALAAGLVQVAPH